MKSSSLYLSLRGVEGSPVAGLELVQFVELQADVLDGELQHVPEAGQILSHRSRVSVGVLSWGKNALTVISQEEEEILFLLDLRVFEDLLGRDH